MISQEVFDRIDFPWADHGESITLTKDELAAKLREAEQAGFKRGVMFYERNQETGRILVRYHEKRK